MPVSFPANVAAPVEFIIALGTNKSRVCDPMTLNSRKDGINTV